MSEKRSIVSLRPSDTPEYMTGAWLGCIDFGLRTPKIIDQFRAETGNHWIPPEAALEQMIDHATGADWAFLVDFIKWVNGRLWGPLEDADEDLAAFDAALKE